jgi:cytochrome b561
MDPDSRASCVEFGRASKALHWLIALLVLAELALGQWMSEGETREFRRTLLDLHKSNGMLIGALVAIRLAWRLRTGLPAWPPSITAHQRKLLHAVEGLLYLGMVAMPLTGLSQAMAGDLTLSFFGWFEIPSLLRESDLWHERLEIAHEFGAKAFFAAILAHTALVLYLNWKASPGFLARMLPSLRAR